MSSPSARTAIETPQEPVGGTPSKGTNIETACHKKTYGNGTVRSSPVVATAEKFQSALASALCRGSDISLKVGLSTGNGIAKPGDKTKY